MEMYQKIRTCRLVRGVKQTEIARKIQMNPKTYHGIESGRIRLTVDTFEAICKLGLNVNPSCFFDEHAFQKLLIS